MYVGILVYMNLFPVSCSSIATLVFYVIICPVTPTIATARAVKNMTKKQFPWVRLNTFVIFSFGTPKHSPLLQPFCGNKGLIRTATEPEYLHAGVLFQESNEIYHPTLIHTYQSLGISYTVYVLPHATYPSSSASSHSHPPSTTRALGLLCSHPSISFKSYCQRWP